MLHMMTYEEGRKSYIFYLHHVVTIAIVGYLLYYPELTDNIPSVIIVFLLEASSACVNITALYKQFIKIYIQQIELLNISVYCMARIIGYPISIICLSYIFYIDETLTIKLYLFPIIILSMLYGVCLFWFRTMVLKYYKKYYTLVDTTTPTHNLLS
jgi:hypothetical protein